MSSEQKAKVIVLGNEKGGTGKSTMAMHIVGNLMACKKSVAVIDLDYLQQSTRRFVENRRSYSERHTLNLRLPAVHVIDSVDDHDIDRRQAKERERFSALIRTLEYEHDYIIIDCPGSNTHLSRLAHVRADTLVTPMNDSFIDLDLLVRVDPDTYKVEGLSHYAEIVWESRKQRNLEQRPPLDWVVARNRIASLQTRNNVRMDNALKQLQSRVSFRYVPGLSERVVYRELFPKGLTIIDFFAAKASKSSHLGARREIRQLMEDLKLPVVETAWVES